MMMIHPPHMLWNAIDVLAPPAGYTPLAGDGSTADSARLQALLNDLPINGSRTLFFPHPPDHYSLTAGVQIGVSGTNLIFERPMSTSVRPLASGQGPAANTPWFLIKNFTAGQPIERVRIFGGLFDTEDRAPTGGGDPRHVSVAVRIDYGRFCVVERCRFRFFATAFEVGASGAGQVSEFCGWRYCHFQGSATSGDTERVARFGTFKGGGHNGSHRHCFDIQNGIFGASNHPIASDWDNGEDGLAMGGDKDSCATGHMVCANMKRMLNLGFWTENTTTPLQHETGATGTRIGVAGAGSGAGTFVTVGT